MLLTIFLKKLYLFKPKYFNCSKPIYDLVKSDIPMIGFESMYNKVADLLKRIKFNEGIFNFFRHLI